MRSESKVFFQVQQSGRLPQQ